MNLQAKNEAKGFCRTCLTEAGPLFIMNDELITILQQCISVKVEMSPGQCQVCTDCKRIIDEWNCFKTRFLKVEIILNNHATITKQEPYEDIKVTLKKENDIVTNTENLECYADIDDFDDYFSKPKRILGKIKRPRVQIARKSHGSKEKVVKSKKTSEPAVKLETVESGTCQMCAEQFKTHRLLLQHWLSAHKGVDPPFSCTKCHCQFCSESLYHQHLERHTPAECMQCRKTFKNRRRLQCHISFVHRAEPAPCSECNRVYKHAKQLREHVKTHTGAVAEPEKTLCIMCGVSVRAITTHMRRCQRRKEQKTFACRFCKIEFDSLMALREHQKQLHKKDKSSEDMKHECELCGKKFTNSSNLYHHRKTHSDDKPFQCSICMKFFKRKREVKSHMQTHSDIRPFACEYCDKRFRQRSKLIIHHRIHTGEKPYACESCHAEFARLDALKLHTNKQHNSSSVPR